MLRFFQRRINDDWGDTQFNGRFPSVVIYVSFTDGVDRRWMEQLAWGALVDICRNDVLRDSLAALRLEHLSDDQVNAVVKTDDGVDNGNLLDNAILEANQIAPAELDNAVEDSLVKTGVDRDLARFLARGEFEIYLRGLRRDGNLLPYYVPRDTKGLEYSRRLLFNDLVRYLRAAGYAGGYLFVDDIENLTDQMQRRHRLEFAKEFGLCTVRPGYANTEHNFFSCVLSTHQQSSLALSQAWNEAGLSAMARLDPNASTSVELPLPTLDQARAIVIAHLDYFRIDQDANGTAAPFTTDGMSVLVGRSPHPRDLLVNAARAVQRAADKGVISFDVDTVREAMDDAGPMATADFTAGIDEAL